MGVFGFSFHHNNDLLFLTLSTAFPLFTHRFDTNRFLLLWRFDDQADKVFYHLRVKTTGWVGFGFAETAPNNMQNYDVIVAGYNNGQGYLWVSCYLISGFLHKSKSGIFRGAFH